MVKSLKKPIEPKVMTSETKDTKEDVDRIKENWKTYFLGWERDA